MAEPITDEDALISAARAGNTDAFLQLQRIYLPAVWDFAIRCTLDDDAATDVAREVFLRASRRIGELTANAQLPVLLFGLAVRQLAFREPAAASGIGEQSRFHAWPVGAPEGYVDAQDTATVWAAMRSYGAEYKGLDLYVRRGLRSGDIAGALDSLLTEESSVIQEIQWSLATVDAALGPIGDSQLTATSVFAGLKLVEPPHEVAAALWLELRTSFAPAPRGPRVLAVMGIAAIGVLATAGSLKAFTGEEPTSVLSAQELRAVVRSTTTLIPESSTTLAPGPPLRVTTSVATDAPATTTPGSPVTTTTRRTIAGPFVAPSVPTTTQPAGGDGGTGTGTGTSSSTTRPGTTVPGTTPPTTIPGSPSTSSTTTRPTTTVASTTTVTSTTRPPTTTAPPTTAPPTTAPPTTAPPTTAPPTTAPPTTLPPTTTVTTTLPPTTTVPPTTTTTEPPPPPTTTEPPVPVIP